MIDSFFGTASRVKRKLLVAAFGGEEKGKSKMRMQEKPCTEDHDLLDPIEEDGEFGRCPECDAVITQNRVNVEEKIALCSCGALARLSELTWSTRSQEEILAHVPDGCSLNVKDQGMVASASLRNHQGNFIVLLICIGTTAFTFFGLISGMVGLTENLVGPFPDWLPVPRFRQHDPSMGSDEPLGLLGSLMLFVCMLPFGVAAVAMDALLLLSLRGKIQVVVDQEESYVATGVGMLQWKRPFDRSRVTHVGFALERPSEDTGDSRYRPNKTIEIRSDRLVRFGFFLERERRQWLKAVSKKWLVPNSDGG